MQKREQHKPKTDEVFDSKTLGTDPMCPRYKCVLEPVDPQEVIEHLTKERDALKDILALLAPDLTEALRDNRDLRLQVLKFEVLKAMTADVIDYADSGKVLEPYMVDQLREAIK